MDGPHRSTEQLQVFLKDLRESFGGVMKGQVQDTLKKLMEADSEQQMEQYLGLNWYERAEEREDSRNGFYGRDYVTPGGIIRFRVRRTRQQSFLPRMLRALERRAHDEVKRDAQAIYLAPSLAQARRAFQRFMWNWQRVYPRVVKGLEKDLPELLNFFSFPRHLWRKLRTSNAIERCFVEVRRRTRHMVVFTNVASVDRIIYAIFNRFNEDWKNRTLELFTQAA